MKFHPKKHLKITTVGVFGKVNALDNLEARRHVPHLLGVVSSDCLFRCKEFNHGVKLEKHLRWRCLIWRKGFHIFITRWWFRIFLMFTPTCRGNGPIWWAYFLRWVGSTTNQSPSTNKFKSFHVFSWNYVLAPVLTFLAGQLEIRNSAINSCFNNLYNSDLSTMFVGWSD